MKTVIINGQNHKGSTYHIGKILVDKITRDNEVKEFFLPRDLNHFCMGCYMCIEDESKCPYFDEKNKIMQEIEQADLLIFTTPNYCMAPSAPMKAFMDLTFTYWFPHKPREYMFHKRAVVISTTAGAGAKTAIKPVAKTLAYWGISNIKKYGVSVHAMNWEGVSQKKKEKIARDMTKLAKKINKNTRARVSIKTKLLFNMFLRMQKSNMGSSPTEKKYWEDNGWLGKARPWKNPKKPDKEINQKYQFRYIHLDEAEQAADIEQICFPPNEACTREMMKDRIKVAADFFLVAVNRETGEIVGTLSGLATDESSFRDEFFTDAKLHNPTGENLMILGLDVLPKCRKQGLAREIMFEYLRKERERGRKRVVLTCLDNKVKMYEKMGFKDLGMSNSNWGSEKWHEMSYALKI